MVQLTRRGFLTGAAATAGAWALDGPGIAWAGSAARPPALRPPDVSIGWTRVVYDRVKAERVLPPAAARTYAYIALAGYEAVVGGMPRHRSLGGQLNDFPVLPSASGLDWEIAMNEAINVVARALFADRSPATLAAIDEHYRSTAMALAYGAPQGLRTRSVGHGRAVGERVAARAGRDHYAETRGRSYTPVIGPDKWTATPPNFGAAIEPHWGELVSFTLAGNDECRPERPLPYSEAPGSAFWAQAKTVHDTVAGLTDAQRATALFWRDNPDGSTGLPSGHWMLNACAVSAQLGLDLGRTAEVLVLVGLALADAFTSCWTEKYETNLLRPVTYIQRAIDPGWASPVNSPAFPEYTSGHSVGSGAAAEVLTRLLGNVAYADDVGLQNGYPVRRFSSFRAAAEEAAASRLYGGIHYPMAISAGLDQGIAVANKVLDRAHTQR